MRSCNMLSQNSANRYIIPPKKYDASIEIDDDGVGHIVIRKNNISTFI